MKKLLLIFCFLGYWANPSFSQTSAKIKWWNPASHDFPVVEGQAWPEDNENFYDRLPSRAKSTVRESVWNLSRHSTGLMIRFRSNAETISVRYTVTGNQQMNHMPATGVSGVDLYAIDSDGTWMWCRGNRTFSDTIRYQFSSLKPNDGYHQMGREYRLYLPLYTKVDWLEIGVSGDVLFRPLPVRKEKPIVVYGTSIAHGACASRPGMAWTNILSRKVDRPLINLAFSGNGRLEKELIDLIQEIDAKIFILDCLPNLTNADTYSDEELTHRIINSVQQLKNHKPDIPILISDHAGYTDGLIDLNRMNAYTRVNLIQKQAFNKLKSEGVSGIFYLSREDIGLQLDDMVDGTHPNDLGMMHYAEGYEKAVRRILNETIGIVGTTIPTIQYREPGNYDWDERHREILEMNKTTPPKTIIFANSIVHFWGGLPASKIAREPESWEVFTSLGIRNYAYGWDRIENVLWRVYHGELDGFSADHIVVMIGTNNLHLNSDEEIIKGLDLLIKGINIRQPDSRISLLGLLPRRDYETRIEALNLQIGQLAGELNVRFGDIGFIFLNSEGRINESFFSDGLHPNKAGYLALKNALLPLLNFP